MGELTTLTRQDIVGKRIRNIYQSAWDVDADGYGSCEVFVELQDGTSFALQSNDFGVVHAVSRVDLSIIDAQPVSDPNLRDCIGQPVLEVLACEQWPGMGLHVGPGSLMFYEAFPSGRGWLVGPFATPIDHPSNPYHLSDTVPYWEQRRIE